MRVLFILKRKQQPYGTTGDQFNGSMETGLLNSARFVEEMLREHAVDAKLVVVHDNNDIDREVTRFRPNIVIIEALWVVPEKFRVLQRLHPDVKWVVRLHSALPFIANEGSASKWILGYLDNPAVSVSCNDLRILGSLRDMARVKFNWPEGEYYKRILYQPNYYPTNFNTKGWNHEKAWVDVACFGAIRPLKNQLIQAVAAIKFAHRMGKHLRFHINGTRIEMKGAPILHNLVGLFEHIHHELIMHDWAEHADFKQLTAQMDIGLQVSYTETFNIVAADLISQGVPVIGSTEVPWIAPQDTADPNSVNDIVDKMMEVYSNPDLNVARNQDRLREYDHRSVKAWFESFRMIEG